MKTNLFVFVLWIFMLSAKLAADFTIGLIPDTQILAWNNYSSWGQSANINQPLNQQQTLNSMTQFYADRKDDLDLVFVASLGDMVETNNNGTEWGRIDQMYNILTNAQIPFSPAQGNHDGSASLNSTFPSSDFQNRSWSFYGGSYNNEMENSYYLFSAEGMDFIILVLEYTPNNNSMDWGHSVMNQHADRRGILVVHHFFSEYSNFIRQHDNIFLGVQGHDTRNDGEDAWTLTSVGGNTQHLFLSDYQARPNGGAIVRYYTFRPNEDRIYARTYDTSGRVYEMDGSSEFDFHYDMDPTQNPVPGNFVDRTEEVDSDFTSQHTDAAAGETAASLIDNDNNTRFAVPHGNSWVQQQFGGNNKFTVKWYSLTSSPYVFGPSQVLNDSFENGETSWSVAGDARIIQSEKYHGNSALEITGVDTGHRAEQTVTLVPNTDYLMGFWVKANDLNNGRVIVDLNDVFDANTSYSTQWEVDPGEATNWTYYEAYFYSGVETSVKIRIYSRPDFSGSVYFDKVFIMPIDEDPELGDPLSWNLRASNDGSNWTTIHSVPGVNFIKRNDRIEFACDDNNTAYEYYRLEMTNNGGPTIHFAELELFGDPNEDGGGLPPNFSPVWQSSTISKATGAEGAPYSGSLSGDVSDPEGDPLVIAKSSGPAWLNIASDGSLSGTPDGNSIGLNSFVVTASDGINSAVAATLEIQVNAAPMPNGLRERSGNPGDIFSLEYPASTYGDTSAYLFDSDVNTKFITENASAWVQHQFGSGKEYKVRWYALTSAVDAPVSTPVNVVQNDSFETGGASPTSWNLGNSAAGSAETAHGGTSFSLKITNSSSPTTQTVTLEPNTDYDISVWINVPTVTAGIAVFDTGDVFDANGQGQFVVDAPTSGWEPFNGSFNSGAVTSINLRMFSSTFTGTAYFDNVTIIPSTSEDPATMDPASWTLSGSNDGSTWTSIDSRSGVSFSARGERLEFSALANDTAYEYYRLDATNGGGSVLQFAELELWGEITAYEECMYSLNGIDPYLDQWKLSLPDVVFDPLNDTDGDGIPDVMECSLGGDPSVPDADVIGPRVESASGGLSFNFKRGSQDLTYTVEKSSDLINWTDHATISDLHGSVGQSVQVDVPEGELVSGKLFLRLKIED